jgi:hypothetical protein
MTGQAISLLRRRMIEDMTIPQHGAKPMPAMSASAS